MLRFGGGRAMAVVLISGCSTGIGLETAVAFARNGDTVVATMRDVSKSQALLDAASGAGVSVDVEQLDVCDDASVTAAVDATLARHGRIDVLVNNAGVGPIQAFENASAEDISVVFNTNLFGAMRLTKAVMGSMREQKSGSILNVSSVASRVSGPGMSMYAASKAALSSFTQSLAGELAPFGVRVASIEPGFYATPILEKAISSLSADGNPYSDTERRLAMVIGQAASQADDPAAVATLMVDTVGAAELDDIRIIVGDSGHQSAEGHANRSDADYLQMCSAKTDEEYFALFAEAFSDPA
jgi:NAD(P)-dependent dehydrogenase (short-subunit alcohol dehydrogenase family)